MSTLARRITRLESGAAEAHAAPVMAVYLDTGRGDFVQRGYFGKPEPCADVAAVLAEAQGQGFALKIYGGIDPDWL